MFQNTKSFPVACAALFQLLVAQANIIPGLDILDVGSGCGDSTALLAETKPHTLRGVTSHKLQSALSRQRFPHVQFVPADAVEYVASLPNESVDRVFALDCVYHFSSRIRFLQESLRVIRDNGRIAITDLILGDNITRFQRLLMRVICFITGSPYSNFKTRKEYHKDFTRAGFADISIEDISGYVFPGLQEFISHHRQEMARFGISGKWTGYMVFARVLKWWWKTGVVRFVVVHARKRGLSSKTIL